MNIKNLKPNYNGKYKQGYFQPKNLYKYVGDPNLIISRSSYEFRFMTFCDIHPNVIKWGSEPFPIKYLNPISGNINNYNVDFYMVTEVAGVKKSYLVEVKPEKQRYPPDPKKLNENVTAKRLTRYNEELKAYLINQAKWKAATQFANSRGMHFKIADESFLF